MSYGVTFTVQFTGASYLVREVDAEDAADHGCPGATHTRTGRYETCYGSLTEVTGRVTRRGVLAQFTPYGAPETGETLRGYVK